LLTDNTAQILATIRLDYDIVVDLVGLFAVVLDMVRSASSGLELDQVVLDMSERSDVGHGLDTGLRIHLVHVVQDVLLVHVRVLLLVAVAGGGSEKIVPVGRAQVGVVGSKPEHGGIVAVAIVVCTVAVAPVAASSIHHQRARSASTVRGAIQMWHAIAVAVAVVLLVVVMLLLLVVDLHVVLLLLVVQVLLLLLLTGVGATIGATDRHG